ncbi:MAG: hypothetical protein R6W70_04755 [bacterium]
MKKIIFSILAVSLMFVFTGNLSADDKGEQAVNQCSCDCSCDNGCKCKEGEVCKCENCENNCKCKSECKKHKGSSQNECPYKKNRQQSKKGCGCKK